MSTDLRTILAQLLEGHTVTITISAERKGATAPAARTAPAPTQKPKPQPKPQPKHDPEQDSADSWAAYFNAP